MTQPTQSTPISQLKSKSAFILPVAVAFFAYELWLLAHSFAADANIYNRVAQSGFTFWNTYWVTSELVGEVGLITRFAGACFFLAFPILVLFKSRLALPALRKAVLLEAIQYLFFLPFISYLFLRPFESFAAASISYEAAISYILQLAIVTPTFLMLYLQLRKPAIQPNARLRWVAIAGVAFVFSLWTKHFIFSLYALPMNFHNLTLTAGFLNSALTMLVAALLLTVALEPTIRRQANPNWKLAGVALCIVSIYFIVYVSIAITVDRYLWYLALTELWAVSLPFAAFGFLMHKSE